MVLRQKRLHVRVRLIALHHKRLPAHLLRRDMVRMLRAEALRHHAHQPVAVERAHRQVARARRGEEAEVHRARLDPLDDVIVGALADLNLHAGILLLVGVHDLRQPRHADAVERADLDRAALHAVELADGLAERLIGAEHLTDEGVKRLAAAREADAALAAHKERKAARFLHRADSVADRAGRQVQNLRGAGKAALLRHGVKDAVFQQRHGVPPGRRG